MSNVAALVESIKTGRPCYRCGEQGHWKRDCPKRKENKGSKSTASGKGAANSQSQKERPTLKHKRYHCTLHKDAPGKNCSTWSCISLKYTPVEERIKLMKENGDCELCCGDCPRGKCEAKFKRTCGANKQGRGCGTNHLGHELFCRNAQLCFSTHFEQLWRLMENLKSEFFYK